MELGAWADWVNAFGTYLAVGGAGFAGVVALRSYRAQQRSTELQLSTAAQDEARRAATEKQAQASKVAVWVFRGRSKWSAQLVNASDLPVYRLVVHVHSDSPAFSLVIERGTQGPSAPEVKENLTNAVRHALRLHDALDMDPDDLQLAIAFTDGAGYRWLRDESGRLHETVDDFNFDDVSERVRDRDIPMSAPDPPDFSAFDRGPSLGAPRRRFYGDDRRGIE